MYVVWLSNTLPFPAHHGFSCMKTISSFEQEELLPLILVRYRYAWKVIHVCGLAVHYPPFFNTSWLQLYENYSGFEQEKLLPLILVRHKHMKSYTCMWSCCPFPSLFQHIMASVVWKLFRFWAGKAASTHFSPLQTHEKSEVRPPQTQVMDSWSVEEATATGALNINWKRRKRHKEWRNLCHFQGLPIWLPPQLTASSMSWYDHKIIPS